MKKPVLVLLLSALSSALFAQKIKVKESEEHIGGGTNNALVVTVYEASADAIEKGVKSLLKDYNAKIKSQEAGWFGNNAVIKKMVDHPVDIYIKWESINDNETKISMAFDLGSEFVSSSKDPAEYAVAKDIVQNFAVKISTEAIQTRVTAEQKSLDHLNNEENKLEKENENLSNDILNYNQKIEDYKQKIKKAQDDIETNRTKRGDKKQEINEQQRVLDAAKEKLKALN